MPDHENDSTIPNESNALPKDDGDKLGPLNWIMEGLRRLEDKVDKMRDKIDEVERTVRDIQTKEEAIKEYKKEIKDDTRDRRDFVTKLVTIILIGIGVIVSIVTYLGTLNGT